MNKLHWFKGWLAVALSLIILWVSQPLHPVQAQLNWVPDQPIPDYDDRRPPFLVADNNQTVHALYSLAISEDEVAIFYRQWRLRHGWGPANDILIWPRLGMVVAQGLYLDDAGTLHLIFFDDGQDAIYYMYAPAAMADRAPAWSNPVEIGTQAGPLPFAELSGNDNGELIVLYGGQERATGLYEVHSRDSGETWSAPTLVAPIYEQGRWPGAIRSDIDEQGRLHAVWSIVSEAGVGEEIYYARLNQERTVWERPTLLAQRVGDDYSANWPSIIAHQGELFVIYQNSVPATRWMLRSLDGGETWRDPVRPFPHVGEYEHAVLLVDSRENLHMILGNRIGNPAIHGMWHTRWLGDRWRDLEPIVSGPPTSQFDPSAPRAVISQGNVLLVTWWHNTPDVDVPWFSYTTLDTPQLSVQPLPMPTPLTTPTATPALPEPDTSLPATNMVAPDVAPPEQPAQLSSNSPMMPLIAGTLPVLLIVLVLTLAVHWRNN